MKFLFILAMFVGSAFMASGQSEVSDPLNSARSAYENGEYEQTIAVLDAFEKARGTSPRLESLRALAYNELGKTVEAYKALQVYFRLTANRDLSGNEAHQDLIRLRDELAARIEKEFEEKKKKADVEREKEADRAVAELERAYRSPETRRAGSSVPPPAGSSSATGTAVATGSSASTAPAGGLGADALAELEMWRKISQSTVAMDYFLFLETFPAGRFAEIARKKMHEIGDPVWNELKKSNDPFKYRDYIKVNPDSPFLDQAKARLEVLTVAAVEWEKVRATDDVATIMKYISSNPSGPFTEDAKRLIEPRIWAATEGPDALPALEFYSLNYQDTERGRAAAVRLAALKSEIRESELRGITERVLSANGHKAMKRVIGSYPENVWFENRIVDRCTIESTSYRDPPSYEMVARKLYTIDLKLVHKVELWSPRPVDGIDSYKVALLAGPGRTFLETSHNLRKSKNGLREAYGPFFQSWSSAVVLETLDAQRAEAFAADLKRLRELCN